MHSCSVEVFPRRPEPWLRLKSTRPAAAVRRHRRDRARLDRAPNRVAIRRSAVHSGHAALRVDLPLRGGFFDQDAVDPLRAGFLGHQPQAEPLAQHAGKEAADRVLLPAGRLHDGRDGRALLALECFEFRGGRLCGNKIKSSLSPRRGARAEVRMRDATRLVTLIAIILLLPGMLTARAAKEVDLLLVLSSDVSRSIDTPKFKLQRDGYAAAIVNPRVVQAIRWGALGKIGVSFVEWSGVGAQKIVIDWTVIHDEASAKDFS